MPGSLKTEAIVLRSIRYGEADRILHLYTPAARAGRRDRQGGAPGPQPVRRAARAVLPHPRRPARGPRRAAHGHRRGHRRRARARCASTPATLDAAARACDAVARLFETRGAASGGVPPARQRAGAAERRLRPRAAANGLAFRLKLLLAAGILPQLATCAACGEQEHLRGFSAAAGRRRLQRLRGRRRSRSARSPTASWSTAVGTPLGAGAGGLRARAAPGRARDLRDRRAPRARSAAPAACAACDELRHNVRRRRRPALSESVL